MRYMQIVKAADIDVARTSYLDMLGRQGIVLAPMTEVYVESVHRPRRTRDTWLCYISLPGRKAA